MAIELYYGDSLSGKTTAMEALIRHLYERTGKKARVWIGDGGGESFNSHGLVDEGVIELWDFSSRDYPMTVLRLMSDLYWPKNPLDPKSKLEAPPANYFDTYGVNVFEGGTAIGQYLLSDVPGGMAWHGATGTGFGGVKDEDSALSTRDNVGGYDDNYTLHGAVAPKHYGEVQRKLRSAIRATKKFPGLTIWTAHPTEAPDRTEGGKSGDYGKITGKTIIGPDFGGKALASLISKEFGNTLHFDTRTIMRKERDTTQNKDVTIIDREYRLYTRRHVDPNGQVIMEFIAGNRAAVPKMVKDFYVSSPENPGDSILQFYGDLKAAREAATNKPKGV